MEDKGLTLTIEEVALQWGEISQLPKAMHFGQYVKMLESKGYTILYSGDKYEVK